MSPRGCYPDKAPAVDDLLDALSHHLRREIIYYFENCTETETATLDELVEHVDERIPSRTREQLQLQLNHVHLPKLEEKSWLDYDSKTGHIHYHGHDKAEAYIDEIQDIFRSPS